MANDAPLARSETEMHLVMTGRVASHTIGLSGVTQNIDVVEIGTSTIEKAISAAGRDIDNIGMVSMDSLFCPYLIGLNWETHASLPYWQEPSVSGEVTATNLNPFNPARSMTSASIFYESGPNLGIYNSVETLGEGDFCQFKNLVPNDQSEVLLRLNSIKAVGFKAPIILTGWGYDTGGKPVPADTGNPDVFASGAFRDPSLWKSGPLDARWDDNRKVWAAGGSTEIIKFTVDSPSEDIGSSSAGCNYVITTVTDIGQTTSSVAVGDTGIRVFDEGMCFFNLPISVLIGMKGTAQAFKNIYDGNPASGCISASIVSAPFRWVVTGMCCGEEINA